MRRRTWLLAGVAASGACVLGWSMLPLRSRLGDARSWGPVGQALQNESLTLNGWIRLGVDGRVQLAMPRSEMGQGVHTALAVLVAEELEVDPRDIQLLTAGHDSLYGNVAVLTMALPVHPQDAEPGHETATVRVGRWMLSKVARELGLQMTGGSTSVADAWEPLRWAAAMARAQLLRAAAQHWNVSEQSLLLQDSQIRHPERGALSFAELATQMMRDQGPWVTGPFQPKPVQAWSRLAHRSFRVDSLPKSRGEALFGQDVRLPGQWFAAVHHHPVRGAREFPVDPRAQQQALAQSGVRQVVALPSVAGSTAAVAVVATHSHAALRVAAAWPDPPDGSSGPGATDGPAADSSGVEVQLVQRTRQAQGHVFHHRGQPDAVWPTSARQLEAVYTAPYLAHAPMETMNCTAQVSEGRVQVWVPTQVPGLARRLAAEVAGVEPEAVTVHVTYLGGAFGRRLDIDFVGQAVRVAMAVSPRPVQLLWSRSEDLRHDFYRPAAAARLQAALDAQGRCLALRIDSASDAITPRHMARAMPHLAGPVDMPDATAAQGLFDLPYEIAHQRIAHEATRSGIPVGFWRSVGHSHNAFFSEGFIDELAHAAGMDPLNYRLSLLQQRPRHRAVLILAAQQAQWDQPLPPGVARGVSLHESFGTIVAQVLEVRLLDGQPQVLRAVCAVDCGVPVHPQGVAQQMESAVTFGLTAALYGRIDVRNGRVQQSNFHDYPMLRMAQAPLVQTHIVASTRAPTGMGEPGTPGVAPALAQALFALTGQRLRSLPLRLQTAGAFTPAASGSDNATRR